MPKISAAHVALSLGGAVAAVFSLAACGPAMGDGPHSAPVPVGPPSELRSTPPRVVDRALGASYIVPKGFHVSESRALTAFAGHSSAKPARDVVLVLDNDLDIHLDLWRLSVDSPLNSQFATMDVANSVAFLADMVPKDEHDVVTERASWGSPDFPASAISVITLRTGSDDPSAEPSRPRQELAYAAFLGKDDRKWMVQTSVCDFPDGVSPESVSDAGEALARSVEPL